MKFYTSEFKQLMLKCDLSKPEENIIARCLGEFRPSLVKIVQLQPYCTLRDVQSLAFKVEKLQRSHRVFTQVTSSPINGPTSRVIPSTALAEPVNSDTTESRKFEWGSSSTHPSVHKCYKCDDYGHIASGCPTMNLILLLNKEKLLRLKKKKKRQ